MPMPTLSPAPRARNLFGSLTWGSAALHPRLYAVARSAGWFGRGVGLRAIRFAFSNISTRIAAPSFSKELPMRPLMFRTTSVLLIVATFGLLPATLAATQHGS